MCGGITMNNHTRSACLLFAAFLALAWSGTLSAQDAPQSPAAPVEKKTEAPAVKKPSPAVKEKPAEKEPVTKGKDVKGTAGGKPAAVAPVKKAPPAATKKAPAAKNVDKKPAAKKKPNQETPAKVKTSQEKKLEDKHPDVEKVEDKKPGDKKMSPAAPLKKKRIEKKSGAKKPAEKKPVKKAPVRAREAVIAPKEPAVKTALPAIVSEPPKPYYRIMRADVDDAVFADWSALRTENELHNWAKSQGLVLAGNAPPLVGGKARFTEQYGSTLKLDGLNRNAKYRLYLDFVTFDDPSRLNVPAALEIYLDGLLAKRLSFGELSPHRNPVVLDIPYQLAMDGTVEVLFREHSRAGGFFGLWDAVLTDQYTLPASFDEPKRERATPKSMQVKDAPLEVRPVIKKRPAKIERGPKKDAAAKEKPAEKKSIIEQPAEKPGEKKADETATPPAVKKPVEETLKEPAAPKLRETPSRKDPAAPTGPAAPQQPK